MVRVLVGALCAAALVSTAHADAFLLKGGGRVYGKVESEYTDDYKKKWIRVRTTFGTVSFQKSHLKRKLPQKGDKDTVHLEELRVVHVAGDVRKSSDGGKTWLALRMPSKEDDTAEPVWPDVRPGDRVRTGDDGKAEIDIGFGLVRVDKQSEMGFAVSATASMSVLKGRIGADVEPPEGDRTFRVETPQASMGVRGTLFLVEVADDTRVGVASGAVDVGGELVEAGGALDVTAAEAGDLTNAERAWLREVEQGVAFPDVDWIVVPPGKFQMGGTTNLVRGAADPDLLESQPEHRVSVPGLLLGRTEITWEQYDVFRAWTQRYGDSAVIHRAHQNLRGSQPKGHDYATFARRKVGRELDTQPANVAWRNAWGFAFWIGGRLPSEAEWEYSARAGSKGSFYWGDDPADIVDHEWVLYTSGDTPVPWRSEWGGTDRGGVKEREFINSSTCRPRPVGTMTANRFGLHDMLGNLAEWCEDTAHADYEGAPTDGSAWVTAPLDRRVWRGNNFHQANFLDVWVRFAKDDRFLAGIRLARDRFPD